MHPPFASLPLYDLRALCMLNSQPRSLLLLRLILLPLLLQMQARRRAVLQQG
jgi:hypothetical protein